MNSPKNGEEREIMKKEQGFSLIELLIVVAIIAIIAAIAVPSMLQARMAANEAGAIQGCRSVGSAEVAFAAVNNQTYDTVANLVTGNFLDARYTAANGFNGYTYANTAVHGHAIAPGPSFGVWAVPRANSTGRYSYGINDEQVVFYEGVNFGAAPANCGAAVCVADVDPIGTQH
jgi:prepilin-type N-terminal cleavage/methylation domain-containing protein